jgi:hypothetical protein
MYMYMPSGLVHSQEFNHGATCISSKVSSDESTGTPADLCPRAIKGIYVEMIQGKQVTSVSGLSSTNPSRCVSDLQADRPPGIHVRTSIDNRVVISFYVLYYLWYL